MLQSSAWIRHLAKSNATRPTAVTDAATAYPAFDCEVREANHRFNHTPASPPGVGGGLADRSRESCASARVANPSRRNRRRRPSGRPGQQIHAQTSRPMSH
jgi:hypothetical protein